MMRRQDDRVDWAGRIDRPRYQDDRLATSLDHKKHPLGGAFTMRAWCPRQELNLHPIAQTST